MKDHQEFYGTVTCVKSDYFEVEDVDQERVITIKYEDVQKVYEGYGGKTPLPDGESLLGAGSSASLSSGACSSP
ncbi:MAG: hypothetical protein LAO31_13740 [Acidobacteriia bacterium]|nr:hypothetical protein [Terriglobia bacterium]